MELKPGYKATEVGVIPEGWNVLPLRELEKRGVIALSRGKVISKNDIQREPGEYPVYSSSVHNEGLFGRYGRYMLDEELITWSIDGGGHFFHRDHHRFSVTNVCGYMRVDATQADCRFLASQLQHLHGAKSFDYQIKAHPSVIRGEYTVPLPSLLEQRAIAAALSDVDALLAGLTRLIAKKRDLKQAAMQQLLTGQTRLPGFTGEWEVRRLGDVVGTDPEQLSADTPPDFKFKYISLEDVDAGSLRGYSEPSFATAPSRARRRLRRDDVLVSTVRPNLQSHFYFGTSDGFWVCSTGFCVLRCNQGLSHPGYIFHLMFSRGVVRQIDSLLTGSNYPAINSGDVRALWVPWPSYGEQVAISEVLSDMDTEITALEARREKTVALKQAMMEELLTGRTRLV